MRLDYRVWCGDISGRARRMRNGEQCWSTTIVRTAKRSSYWWTNCPEYNTRRIRCLRSVSPISPKVLRQRQAKKSMDNLRLFFNLRILITTARRSVFDRKRRSRNADGKKQPNAARKSGGQYDGNQTRLSTYLQEKCALYADTNH